VYPHNGSGAREIVNCPRRYCQVMSRSVESDRGLGEAEALLDMDGRRERLELVVAGLQSGKVQPVGHATARDRIEKRIRDRRTQ
jgi:hypothetical protein